MAAHRHLAAAQHRRRLPAADHRTVLTDPATVETPLRRPRGRRRRDARTGARPGQSWHRLHYLLTGTAIDVATRRARYDAAAMTAADIYPAFRTGRLRPVPGAALREAAGPLPLRRRAGQAVLLAIC